MTPPEPTSANHGPWGWVPSLYFAEAVPYALVMSASVILYKRLGLANDAIALYTSMLYLPWVLKPFWSPVVEVLGTKRRWITSMQVAIAAGIAGVAINLHSESFFVLSLACLWWMAICSATHDIAADGFYMLALTPHDQAWYVGWRSTAYRGGLIAGQGVLVILAGAMEHRMSVAAAWSNALFIGAGLFLLLAAYHQIVLPRPEHSVAGAAVGPFGANTIESVLSFFQKPGIGLSIAYLLTYRLAEAQLTKLASPFLLDDRAVGGLGLETEQVGLIYGTIGVCLLLTGGILGGWVAARHGLKRWLFPMALAIHLPNIAFVYLAFSQPTSPWLIGLAVAVEQFGYGFGFAGYMLYMLYISQGRHQTAHYAICTGFMALGMMLPGLVSGKLQQWLGYQHFFLWVMVSTIPSFLITLMVPIDKDFGRRVPADSTELNTKEIQ